MKLLVVHTILMFFFFSCKAQKESINIDPINQVCIKELPTENLKINRPDINKEGGFVFLKIKVDTKLNIVGFKIKRIVFMTDAYDTTSIKVNDKKFIESLDRSKKLWDYFKKVKLKKCNEKNQTHSEVLDFNIPFLNEAY